jgi:hypothetical protein
MSAWMLTATGRDHFLSGHEVDLQLVDIYDFAHALATINRYTGHAKRPNSVAEHSLFCAELAQRDGKSAMVQMACLMHDAHEAFSSDLGSPAKNAIGLAWAAFEHRQADVVRRFYGLTTSFAVHKQLVNHYDLVALATERRDLTAFDPERNRAWPPIDTPGREVEPATWVNLNDIDRAGRSWQEWKNLFLARYFQLQREVQAASDALMREPVQQVPV